jgi:hypothetical protein
MSTRCQPTSGPSAISSPRPSDIDLSYPPLEGEGRSLGRSSASSKRAGWGDSLSPAAVLHWLDFRLPRNERAPAGRPQGAPLRHLDICRGDPCGRPPSAPRVQPVSCKGVGQMPVRNQCETWDKALPAVIARSSCDEAIQLSFYGGDGLLRSIERALARPIGSQRRAKICTLPAIMREALIAHHKP